jgi:hypothetical protein
MTTSTGFGQSSSSSAVCFSISARIKNHRLCLVNDEKNKPAYGIKQMLTKYSKNVKVWSTF